MYQEQFDQILLFNNDSACKHNLFFSNAVANSGTALINIFSAVLKQWWFHFIRNFLITVMSLSNKNPTNISRDMFRHSISGFNTHFKKDRLKVFDSERYALFSSIVGTISHNSLINSVRILLNLQYLAFQNEADLFGLAFVVPKS